MDTLLTVVQITDLHILAEQGQSMANIETEKTFQQVLKQVHHTQSHIDLLLVTGDLAQTPCHSSYQRILQTLKNYPTRTICLPGNHDDIGLMLHCFSDKQVNCDKNIQLKNWQVISLNSKKHNATGGYLAPTELIYLSNQLENNAHLNTLIAVHHHPIPTESQWMDTMTIENSAELFTIVKKYPQVKAITCGHIHQEIESLRENTLIFGTPSTCFQFEPLSVDYAVDEKKTRLSDLQAFF